MACPARSRYPDRLELLRGVSFPKDGVRTSTSRWAWDEVVEVDMSMTDEERYLFDLREYVVLRGV
ncbi:MAG: hypothetical protein MK179_18280, partial [Pirellulaceae bacterium]|nr:hypothetical protein [Pirellulaceae bacterium]